jgi:tetratricopeptide (TPR) repeat protein
MYLPLVSIVAGVVVAAYRLPHRVTGLMICGVAAVLTILTIHRNRDYHSEESIWADTVSKRPENPRAHNNLGRILAIEGKFEEAIAEFNTALRLEQDFPSARFNLGTVLLNIGKSQADKGKPQEAMKWYSAAVHVDPDLTEAHVGLGRIYGELGRSEESFDEFSEALRVDPNLASVHHDMGVILLRQGKLNEAMFHFERAVALDPNLATAREARDDLRTRLAATADGSKRETTDDQDTTQ